MKENQPRDRYQSQAESDAHSIPVFAGMLASALAWLGWQWNQAGCVPFITLDPSCSQEWAANYMDWTAFVPALACFGVGAVIGGYLEKRALAKQMSAMAAQLASADNRANRAEERADRADEQADHERTRADQERARADRTEGRIGQMQELSNNLERDLRETMGLLAKQQYVGRPRRGRGCRSGRTGNQADSSSGDGQPGL